MNQKLTPQELKVAEAFSQGMVTKEVAEHLSKSASTVVNQLQSIYDKTRIPRNISALAVWYLCKMNSIDLPEFMRKAGAIMLLVLVVFTINYEDDLRRSRTRRGRRDDIEHELIKKGFRAKE